MGKSIGIDLGTTNSVMSITHSETEILVNREHGRLTPSVVAYRRSKKSGDAILVGKLARDYARTAGKDYLYSVKRLIGRSYEDEKVQEILTDPGKGVTYEIVPSPDGREDVVRIRLGERLYAPREISAMVLRKLKEDAEMRLGDKVESAVITVPAYFSERQKHATREAGLLAGLKVKQVLDEPTAAAIAYGIDQNDEREQMVLVFDLGGGTFDISILLMMGGVFTQMNNEGDMWFGGDDFDQLIANEVIHYVESEYDLKGVTENDDFMHELRRKSCEAKEILSSDSSAEIIISEGLKDESGMPLTVEYEITRNEFERLLRPYVDRAMKLVTEALKNAQLDKDDIDRVLLVGGSSSIPIFQQTIEEYFRKEKVLKSMDFMTCVALGAAIKAKSLGDRVLCLSCNHGNPMDADVCSACGASLAVAKEEVKQVVHIQRTAKPYGIEIKGERFVEIIPKNTVYPMEDPHIERFYTTVPNQRFIKIPVREGFHEEAAKNDLMGNIWFYDLPPGLPEKTPIEVSMALDQDMVFTIGCRIQGIDWNRTVPLQHDGWQNRVLDEAMTSHIEIQKQGSMDEETKTIERHVQGIQQAVESNDRGAAYGHMQEIEKMKAARIQVAEAHEKEDNWKIAIGNIISLGESQLNRVREFLEDDEELRTLDTWLREAKAALQSNDGIRGKQLLKEGMERLFGVPLVRDLAIATILSRTLPIPALATRLEQAKNEMLECFDRKDTSKLQTVIEEFKKVLDQALEEANKSGASPAEIGVWLDKDKGRGSK